jgi:predicted Zn-dependent peptidase
MAPDGLIEIERGEVGGVPAYWPAGAGAPHRVALGFRVGYADETLPEHGITHLVEHLALFALGRRLYDTNGVVDGTSTIFYADGRPDELAEFLRDVTAALHDLPRARLDAEKRVLLAESAGRSSSFPERLKWLRWSETSHGLADVKELGLRRVTAPDVDAWAASWFTAANAGLWLNGPPPDDLALALPPGERRLPSAPAAVAELELPAWLAEGRGGLGLTFVAPPTGLATALETAHERLIDRLRDERGILYDIDGEGVPVGTHRIYAALLAACDDAHAVEVSDELIAVVRELAADGPTPEELERSAERVRRDFSDPAAIEPRLEAELFGELHGRPPRTAEESIARADALTAEQCAATLAEALPTALLVVPAALAGRIPDGFKPWQRVDPPARRPAGPAFREKPTSSCPHGSCEIVVGADQLYWSAGDDSAEVSIPYDRLVAVVANAADERHLIAPLYGGLRFTPCAYEDRDGLLAELRRHVPETRFIPPDDAARAVDELMFAHLEQPEAHGDELDVLADDLAGGERLVLLARAHGRGRPGLLAVTSRRVVHLDPSPDPEEGGRRTQWELSALAAVEANGDRLLLRTQEGDEWGVSDIRPSGRALEAAEEIDRLR